MRNLAIEMAGQRLDFWGERGGCIFPISFFLLNYKLGFIDIDSKLALFRGAMNKRGKILKMF